MTLKIWDIAKGACVATLEGHQSFVDDIAISPDGSLLASTGFTDKTIRIWHWRAGACYEVINANENRRNSLPLSVDFTPDSSRLVVGTVGGALLVFRLGKFSATSAEPERRYVNAKIVLVGQSGVGKTALAHRLIEDKSVKTLSTHGMNVWRLDLPMPPGTSIEREALLWDLAGQQDYKLIHQLFLHDAALALLLIDPQAEDLFAEAADWVRALRMAVRAAGASAEISKLLIPARIDVGGLMVSQGKIDRFLEEHGILASLPTSAVRGDNCSDSLNSGQSSELKELIAKSIAWDNLPWTSTPRLLAALKNALMAFSETGDIRMLRFAELAQRLEAALPGEAIGESDVRTAVRLLANHSLI
jgi:signal recognition particle receptor subunit beta